MQQPPVGGQDLGVELLYEASVRINSIELWASRDSGAAKDPRTFMRFYIWMWDGQGDLSNKILEDEE